MSLSEVFESRLFLTAFLFTVGILIAVMFGIVLYKSWAVNKKNSRMPVVTAMAKIVSRRDANKSIPKMGAYILFEFEDGSRQDLFVKGNDSCLISENDIGTLSFQGTKFISFERNISK